ncbi:SgcJ/EcaC family oxidoreductase [Bradyrhizobium sp. UFLA05-112]
MARRFLVLIGLVLLTISAAEAGPNEDAVAARASWEQVYNAGDVDKFVALYTKDAMLFGSTAQLFTGTDGVRTYFSKLPAGIKVKMGDQQAIAAGPDVVLSSGFADFTLPNGTVLPFRLTLAFVKVDGKWLVAQHHGSPVPK